MATHIEIADTDEGEKIDSAALLEGISAVGYVVLCVLPDSCKLDRIFLAFRGAGDICVPHPMVAHLGAPHCGICHNAQNAAAPFVLPG